MLKRRNERSLLDFIEPQLQDTEAFSSKVRAARADSKAKTDDVIELKDGRVFERHSEPQSVNGKNVGRVWGFRDVTERKRAEEALSGERRLLRTLIDNMPDYIYVKDTGSRFVLANRAVAKLAGVPNPNDLLGKTDYDYFPQEVAAAFFSDEQAIDSIQTADRESRRKGGGRPRKREVAVDLQGSLARSARPDDWNHRHRSRHHRAQTSRRCAARSQGGGGSSQPLEERISGQHEPRNPHAHERNHGHDRAGPRHRTRS